MFHVEHFFYVQKEPENGFWMPGKAPCFHVEHPLSLQERHLPSQRQRVSRGIFIKTANNALLSLWQGAERWPGRLPHLPPVGRGEECGAK